MQLNVHDTSLKIIISQRTPSSLPVRDLEDFATVPVDLINPTLGHLHSFISCSVTGFPCTEVVLSRT